MKRDAMKCNSARSTYVTDDTGEMRDSLHFFNFFSPRNAFEYRQEKNRRFDKRSISISIYQYLTDKYTNYLREKNEFLIIPNNSVKISKFIIKNQNLHLALSCLFRIHLIATNANSSDIKTFVCHVRIIRIFNNFYYFILELFIYF